MLPLIVVATSLGALAAAAAVQFYHLRRRAADTSLWILVANANTLLRLDLDHLAGDDENYGLAEMRDRLTAAALERPAQERKMLERYNALVGIAIAFGRNVHDAHGVVDLRAVANRRAHVESALALGDRIEAAYGGIAELSRGLQPSWRESKKEYAAAGAVFALQRTIPELV